MARLQGALVRRPWWLLGAIAVILLMAATIVRSNDVPQIQIPSLQGEVNQSVAQPGQQTQIDSAPADNPPAQTEPEKWRVISPNWEYTLTVPPMPVGEGIYNGRASDTSWGTGGGGTPEEMERRKIAKHIVPSITDRDAVGLSIVRHENHPEILFAAVHIAKDVQTRAELVARGEFEKEAELAAQEVQETYLGLSMDNGESWTIVEGPSDIDHVIVTGAPSALHLEIRPFSSPGYWKTDVSP